MTVITSDLAQVFALSAVTNSAIASYIYVGSWSPQVSSPLEAILLFSFSARLLIRSLADLLSSRGGLIISRRLISQVSRFRKFFCPRVLIGRARRRCPGHWFFTSWVFYGGSLGGSLAIFCGLLFAGNVLIHLPNHWRGHEAGLRLSFNGFLHQVFPITELFTTIFYLDIDWGPKAIVEETDQVRLVRTAVIKL